LCLFCCRRTLMCLLSHRRLKLIADEPNRVVYRLWLKTHKADDWPINVAYLYPIAVLVFIILAWIGEGSLLFKLATTVLGLVVGAVTLMVADSLPPAGRLADFKRWRPVWQYVRIELDGAAGQLLILGERERTPYQHAITADTISHVETHWTETDCYRVDIYSTIPEEGRVGSRRLPLQIAICLCSLVQAEQLASHIRRFFQVPDQVAPEGDV